MKYMSNSRFPIEPDVADFYRHALTELHTERIPFLIGGAYALQWHTGIAGPTKDLDLMVQEHDCGRVLEKLKAAGYQTELCFPHWLGKVYSQSAFIDVIFSSGNGRTVVDQDWFRYAARGELFDIPVEICSAVELIWSKAFVMERERYDGADVLHLIRTCGADLDWRRLLKRFGADSPILLSHLILFDYVYPSERSCIPEWVMRSLLRRVHQEMRRPRHGPHLCRGTLLSREQYLIDLDQAGYEDPRLAPRGTMSREDIARWTAAIKPRSTQDA